MAHIPPPAEELRILDHELRQLESRRSVLLARRAWLISVLGPQAAKVSTPVQTADPAPRTAPAQAPDAAHPSESVQGTGFGVPHAAASVPVTATPARAAFAPARTPDVPPYTPLHLPQHAPSGGWPAGPAGPGTGTGAGTGSGSGSGGGRPDASPRKVQNVLLVLGGVLLAVAAIAFTVVSWGDLGITGRSLVLSAVTVAALGAPVPLLGRGLRATAEAVAGVGLALTALDAYALHRAALADTDGVGYAAVAAAVLALGWLAYGYGLPALRVPSAASVASGQLPLLLWATAAEAGPRTVTAVLLVTAGADAVLALRIRGSLPHGQRAWTVRLVATVMGCAAGGFALPLAGWLSWQADTPADALRAGALLMLGAAVALGTAGRLARTVRGPSCAAALLAGLAAVAAVGGVIRVLSPGAWTVPGYLVCSVGVLACAVVLRSGPTGLPEDVRRGLTWAGLAVQGLCVLWALPVAVIALLGPVNWIDDVWAGAPAEGAVAVTGDVNAFEGGWLVPHPAVAVLVLFVAAVALAAVGRSPWGSGVRQSTAACGALLLACGAALALPVAFDVSYEATLVLWLLLTTALLALATGRGPGVSAVSTSAPDAGAGVHRSPAAEHTVARLGTVLAVLVSAGSAALALASQTATLVVLAVLGVLFAAGCALQGRARGYTGAAAPACAALACATALAVASGAALDLPWHHTALLVLVVTAGAALLAARLGGHVLTVPVEVGGCLAGVLAVGLASRNAPMLALVLALGGVMAAGTAIRADRRRTAGALAGVLFVLATWVRLGAWDVSTPEAYTLPVTVPALLVGAVRRRYDAAASSWVAYGPGLAVTLLPSLATTWADAHWMRPLLLGTGALLVTLAGARLRLQAPLILGGAVLAVDALHELAPFVVQVAGELPRWVPPALIGLVLLALGATYEQRLRDVRRARTALRSMR